MIESAFGTSSLERRFGGLSRLYGVAGAERIRSSHIVVVGLGGVGSWSAEAAARSGVARLTLVDLDHIAESNINRQVHSLSTTLGQSKVQAMRERIALINPECKVDCIEDFVDENNWPGLLSLNEQFDRNNTAVIDACDQVKAKILMATWAIHTKAILISVGAAGGKKLAHNVEVGDLSSVTHDPLLAQMRYQLRKKHGVVRLAKMKVTCVFSRETVARPLIAIDTARHGKNYSKDPEGSLLSVPLQFDSNLNCHGYGSVVTVTSTFGMCAVSWVLNKIVA